MAWHMSWYLLGILLARVVAPLGLRLGWHSLVDSL